jgi:hypothetical protein
MQLTDCEFTLFINSGLQRGGYFNRMRGVCRWILKQEKEAIIITSFPEYGSTALSRLCIFYLCLASSETESFFLPFALRAARTLRPLAVAILSLKPCLFLLFLCDG